MVDHAILKKKLFATSITTALWSVIDDLYVGGREVVRWAGQDGEPYEVQQGVRQGGVSSLLLYKLYSNNFLKSLAKARLGAHIGAIYVGAVGVADDSLLLAHYPPELQAMLSLATDYSETHKFEIHPVKTVVTHLHAPRTPYQPTSSPTYLLGDQQVTMATQFVHLGMTWQKG